MLVLGIESSCDETAAAIVRDERALVSSVISSQVDIHKRFGGVVPELASREHLDKIVPVVEEAFARAGMSKEEVDGIAVTNGPGLVGSLLVGVSYAKAMAYALGRPLVGINHIEGHIYSVVFENPPIEYPALALIVSGGHTNLFLIPEPGKYKVVARTRDDAAGEAFDKVAKMLAASFQSVVIRSLVGTMERLAEEHGPKTLIVAGGVACNKALREASRDAAERLGVPVYFPSPHLSTDNAAMIAAAGTVKLEAGERAGWDLNADVSLRLQNVDVADEAMLRSRVHYKL